MVLPAPREPAAFRTAAMQGMPAMPAYGPQSYAGYAPAPNAPGGYLLEAPHPARRFTVVGGAELVDEVMDEEPGYSQGW